MDVDIKPLTFDRVMEGTAVVAHNSLLFKVPIEILANIVSQLATSNKDLASLALVNSDCRQLARSCQFQTVKFDFSPRFINSILGLLQREAVERRQNCGRTYSLSLSACIRHVIVDDYGYWKEADKLRPRKPGKSIEDTSWDAYDEDEDKFNQWEAFVDELANKLNEIYRPNALLAISSLIHLERVEILDKIDWSQSVLNNLTASTIKYLSLRDVEMTNVFPIMEDSAVWPLETLHICLRSDFDFSYDYSGPCLNASNSWHTILRSCSASLKVLFLEHCAASPIEYEDVSFSLQLPQLRQLDLTWKSPLDQSALRSLIFTSPWLSTLSVDYGDKVIREFLDCEGQIRSLETLVLNPSRTNIPPTYKTFYDLGRSQNSRIVLKCSLISLIARDSPSGYRLADWLADLSAKQMGHSP